MFGCDTLASEYYSLDLEYQEHQSSAQNQHLQSSRTINSPIRLRSLDFDLRNGARAERIWYQLSPHHTRDQADRQSAKHPDLRVD